MTGQLTPLARQLAKTTNPAARLAIKRRIEVITLLNAIEDCDRCPLAESSIQSVPIDGPTHGRADLVLVGEAPGFNEDKAGRPFVGKSGRVLDRLLEIAGTERGKVAILNTLAHRPPDNRDPKPEELTACRHWFDRQLALAGSWVGVALGGYALANIMGVARSSISVKDYLDTPVWVDGRVWFGTYHPAYALRNPLAKREIVLSIRAALAVKLSEDALLPKMGAHLPAKGGERAKEEGKVLGELDVLGSEKVGRHLHKFGWALMRSEMIGQMIVVIRGDDYSFKKPIPGSMDRFPRWELAELLKVGTRMRNGSWGEREMRTLVMVRDEFGGKVIA